MWHGHLTRHSRLRGYVDRELQYDYEFGQAGTSAVFSQSGSNLVLGCPGILSWTGSLVNYNDKSDSGKFSYRYPNIPYPAVEINYSSYFGYSVTSGSFFEDKLEYYAVGAPRDAKHYGKVYIVPMEEAGFMKIRKKKQGVQLGEYFGASVLGVDLNGDSFADLLVGAPLHSLESAGDEGKVYVYISNGNDLLGDIELTGDSKEGARFGTSLASIGDINQDGFNDIAVGAPYEDGTGAVYIYHGSRSGVNSGYAQKIKAADINSQLSGFGIHISRGHDIDDNGYPDILVGSYRSSNAVLLRSRPVIQVFPEIIFIPRQIFMNQTSCQLMGQNVTCVQVDACLSYSGKHVPSTLDFLFTVTVKDSRGYFYQNSKKTPTVQERIVLEINQKTCSSFWVYFNPGINNPLTPVPVEYSHKLVRPGGTDKKFDATFPIYHPSSLRNITSDIAFMTGCAKENECHSDLVVSVKRTEPGGDAIITLGKVSRVSVDITVINKGEPAYLSELLIYLPPEMPSINQDICEAGNQYNNASLVCHLGNPLENKTKVEINMKLDTTKIPPHTNSLNMTCIVVSRGDDTNPDDNVVTVTFDFRTVSDIAITGFSLQDQIMYNETQTTPLIITHNYIIRNHGPSPLQKIDILLRVPYFFLPSDDQEPFVHFRSLEVDNGMPLSIPAVCEDISLIQFQEQVNGDPLLIEDDRKTSDNFAQENYVILLDNWSTNRTVPKVDKDNGNITESLTTRGHFVIDCDSYNVGCISLRCSASPFTDQRKFSQLTIALQLDIEILNANLGQWNQIEFVTTASISVSDDVIQLRHYPKVAQIATDIIHESLPQLGKIAPSIILASIAVGVFLLIIITLLFIKIGFFERKEKAEMKNLLNNAEENEENIEHEISDTADLKQ